MTSLKQYLIPIPAHEVGDMAAIECRVDALLIFNKLVRCGEVIVAAEGYAEPFAMCLANRDGVNDKSWYENVEMGTLYERVEGDEAGTWVARPILV